MRDREGVYREDSGIDRESMEEKACRGSLKESGDMQIEEGGKKS